MACSAKTTNMLPLNALPVRIGEIEITAVVCTSSWLSLMTQSLYDTVRDKDNCRVLEEFLKEFPSEKVISGGSEKTMKIQKVVVFDVLFCQCPVKLTVSVVETCATDLILGCGFLSEIKSNFSIDKTIFKWKHNEHLTMSSFVTDIEKLRKIDFFQNENSPPIKVINTDITPPAKNKKPTTAEKSKSNDKLTKKTTNSPQGFQLKYYPPKDTSPKKSIAQDKCFKDDSSSKKTPLSTIQDGLATVYVSTRRLINVVGGGLPLGYYGIWWCDDCGSNKIEGLAVEIETMVGLNCRAIAEALKQAQANGISRLRIVINRSEGLDLLRCYTKNKLIKKPGQTKFGVYNAYIMYREACILISKMDEVKFEYFVDNNRSPENLRNLREQVHKFIALSDGLQDNDSPGYFFSSLRLN